MSERVTATVTVAKVVDEEAWETAVVFADDHAPRADT